MALLWRCGMKKCPDFAAYCTIVYYILDWKRHDKDRQRDTTVLYTRKRRCSYTLYTMSEINIAINTLCSGLYCRAVKFLHGVQASQREDLRCVDVSGSLAASKDGVQHGKHGDPNSTPSRIFSASTCVCVCLHSPMLVQTKQQPGLGRAVPGPSIRDRETGRGSAKSC